MNHTGSSSNHYHPIGTSPLLRAIRYAFGADPDGDWMPDPLWLTHELTRLVEQDSTEGARDAAMQDLEDERDALLKQVALLREALNDLTDICSRDNYAILEKANATLAATEPPHE